VTVGRGEPEQQCHQQSAAERGQQAQRRRQQFVLLRRHARKQHVLTPFHQQAQGDDGHGGEQAGDGAQHRQRQDGVGPGQLESEVVQADES